MPAALNNNLSYLILSSSGAHNIPDVQQLIADFFQLLHVFDLEADGEDALVVRQVLAVELLQSDAGGGHDGGHIQQQALSGNAIQLQCGLEGLIILS